MRILSVEDDDRIANPLAEGLKNQYQHRNDQQTSWINKWASPQLLANNCNQI